MTIEQAKNFAIEMYTELSNRDTTPSEEIRAETLVTLYNATAPAEKHKAVISFDKDGEMICRN